MSYGLAIADDRGGMLEIDSLPWVPHALVEFININKAGTHRVKIAPASEGRKLYVAPCGSPYYLNVMSPPYDIPSYTAQYGIHPNKYVFDLNGHDFEMHSIQSYEITPDGWITIVVRKHNNAGIDARYGKLEIWQGA